MRPHKEIAWPAPIRGWVQSGKQLGAKPEQADRLDNFFPTAQNAELRQGLAQFATVPASVARLMVYRASTDDIFAATETAIYDVSGVADAEVAEDPVIRGLSDGDWSFAQMSSGGSDYIVAVNGADHALHYDGADWQPLHDETIYDLPYDALTADFEVGETATGGTSGATAEIIAIMPSSATAGTLKLGAITGTFSDDEAVTSASGAAVANIPSGTSEATTIAVSGVATTSLTQVWGFKRRLFFVESGTMKAWYLPVESVGGTASELNLASVFQRSDRLLFGATWSLDAGDGLDDVCLFVSNTGEVAVYQGTDPSSASTWGLVGRYDIARPLDKHAHFRAGGDLMVMTEDGIVSVAEALRKDRAGLQATAMTRDIEDEWRRVVQRRSETWPINATLWRDKGLLLIGVPPEDEISQAFVANSNTGAWARFTGWDVRCATEARGNLYIGNNDGDVYQAYTGGSDDGVQYTGVWVPKAQGGKSAAWKVAVDLKLTALVSGTFTWGASAFGDYALGAVSAPLPVDPAGDAVWNSGITWDGDAAWDGSSRPAAGTEWQEVAAQGHALAPAIAVTSNNAAAPVFNLLAVHLRFEEGSPL